MFRDINQIDLQINDINPRVIDSYLFTQGMKMAKGYCLPKRIVYDYELEFFVESEGAMDIDDKLFPIHKGDIVFRRPGQRTQAIMPYSCYLICFDPASTTRKEKKTYNFCTEKKNEFLDFYLNPLLKQIPEVFHPISEYKYRDLFDLVFNNFINPSDASPLLLKSTVLEILYHLSQDSHDPLNNNTVLQSPHGKAIKKVTEYINENFSSPLCLNELAKLINLSPNYFHKIFNETMKITPNAYITRLRLEKAKELLAKSNIQVYKIAIKCGFENVPYFICLFKRHIGLSPIEFRKRHNYMEYP